MQNHTVIADENIPFAEEAFSTLGNVILANGRDITSDDLSDADILVVRSVTNVGSSLLGSTDVEFVGTCTIGTDHVDLHYLSERNIGFASAPGCNANSVSEYITAVLLEMAVNKSFSLKERVLGIVGAGNVGSKVEAKALALGMEVILNDPPLKDRTGESRYRPLKEICEADIVTFHVPLTYEGPYPTFHMVSEDFLNACTGRGFINTSRGSVVDSNALAKKLECDGLAFCACDVWEHEPSIDRSMAELTDIGTPHIAGYSFEGKVNGTYAVYKAVCEHFSTEPLWDYADVMGEQPQYSVSMKQGFEENILEAVRLNYDVRDDDRRLRLALESDDIGASFDSLRRNYRKRREFPHSILSCGPDAQVSHTEALENIGFIVKSI